MKLQSFPLQEFKFLAVLPNLLSGCSVWLCSCLASQLDKQGKLLIEAFGLMQFLERLHYTESKSITTQVVYPPHCLQWFP